MPTSERVALIERMYAAFNRREVDVVLATMCADVRWPNGWEGGVIEGTDLVRDYWHRQWAAIDATAVLQGFASQPDGRLRVHVHQTVRDHAGKLLSELSL